MTKMEMEKRLETLEEQEFLIYMIDHWTTADRDLLHKVEVEIKELKEKLQ